MDILLIANPEHRRARFFAEAAEAVGARCRMLPWSEFLRGKRVDAEHVRVESPGENWAVESALLGREEAEDRGRIRGLEVAHDRMREALAALPPANFMNSPDSILAMFDKVETKRRLGAACPRTLGLVRGFEELREVMREGPRRRIFVKPRHGSSASGVVALTMSADRVTAITSTELSGERLYNSLRIRRYEGFREVRRLIDLLGREDELLVEEWVPKATTRGGAFDVRVVVIDGATDHVVVRVSEHPMTNLHLGNRRGDSAAVAAAYPTGWGAVLEAARSAASAFPGALYAGIDIALTSGGKRPVVFEVNAFGDLLPGVLDPRGRDTYRAEVEAYLGSHTREKGSPLPPARPFENIPP